MVDSQIDTGGMIREFNKEGYALLREFAESDPVIDTTLAGSKPTYECPYCKGCRNGNPTQHEPTCPWLRARKLIGEK